MKKFIKLLIAFAVILSVGSAYAAGPFVRYDKITVTTNGLAFTNATFLAVDGSQGGSTVYGALDKIVVANNATSAVTVVTSSEDLGAFTVLDTTAVAASSSTNIYPKRTFSYNAGTNYFVDPYRVNSLRFVGTLASTNAVATNVLFKVYFNRN